MSPLAFLLRNRRAAFAIASVLLLATGSVLAVVASRGPNAAGAIAPLDPARAVRGSGADLLADSDHDGLPDVTENFAYGSDPHRMSTTGSGIPDGWLASFGFDPTLPGQESQPAAAPPLDKLPAPYHGQWPAAFRWTLLDVYRAGRPAAWNESAQGPWRNGVDPRQWEGAAGLPFAWLAHYGLSLNRTDVGTQVLVPGGLTVRQAFEQATDPRTADTDHDGLGDAAELNTYHTDPLLASTSGSGVPDGWLAHYGLDPKDATIGSNDPGHKGMTVLETYRYNAARFGVDATLAGAGLDPTRPSSRAGPIPDGWLVHNGLDPLDPTVADRVVQRASDFDGVQNLTTAPAGHAPLPDLVLHVRDCYAYGRPADWDEARQGPWNGGLNPATKDTDGDGLPDAVELRGWYLVRTVGLGPHPQAEAYVAHSDPRSSDTDGDGLTDQEEYGGQATRNGVAYRWSPSDPGSTDTAFSGLPDSEKVFGLPSPTGPIPLTTTQGGAQVPLLDPGRMDTAGAYMRDGEAAAYWLLRAQHVADPYKSTYLGSHTTSTLDWMAALPRFQGHPPSLAEAAASLGPTGDLLHSGLPNIVNPDVDGDGIPNGMETNPALLTRLPDLQGIDGGPRAATDPANPDTDGDGLPDGWEARHGRFDTTADHWDLDPSKWSSDGSETIGDGDQNLDGDVIHWTSYDGAHAPTDHAFSFTNRLKYAAGTDPRVPDANRDGVTDGWVYFWGKVYPGMVRAPSADADPGTLRPDPAQQPFLDTEARLANPLASVGGFVKGTAPYTRFVEGSPQGQLVAANGEQVAPDWPKSVQVLRDGAKVQAQLAMVTGTYRHTYAQDQRLALNPYLLDTDGDGMPDAWEAGRCPPGTPAALAPDPRTPDAAADPDGDKLGNLQEMGSLQNLALGTSPCQADSDLGGLGDGQELSLGFKPLAPSDDVDVLSSHHDSDGDGVDDSQEALQGTNPALPDSRHNGLLDGQDVTLSTLRPEDGARLAALLAQGIAHRSEGANIHFFGVAGLTDPLKADSLAPGIPDGWLVYHGLATDPNPAAYLPGYQCARPAWWDEGRMGVWWWGVKATTASACLNDLDRDGLDDRSGEDPIPAASHANLAMLPDLSADPAALLVQAQTWGECAGNPIPCRNAATPDAQAPTALEATWPATGGLLPKGAHLQISGHLSCTSTCGGTGDRVVVAHLAGRPAMQGVLGVGFTQPDGSFSFTACLCALPAVTLPHAGMVALGRTGGDVAWPDLAPTLAVGSAVDVRLTAYATTGSQATASSQSPALSLTVSSPGTTLKLVSPTGLPWSTNARRYAAVVELDDAAGSPLAGRTLDLSFGGVAASPAPTTDDQGRAGFAFPVTGVGSVPLLARFGGDGATAGPAPDLAKTVVLQSDLNLKVDAADVAVTGATYTVTVHATSHGDLSGIAIRVSLGPLSGDVATDASGTAVAALAIGDLAPGTVTLTAAAPATGSHVAAQDGKSVDVRTGSVLQFTALDGASVQDGIHVTGSVALASGDPIPEAQVEAALDGAPLVDGLATGSDGRFDGVLTLPSSTSAGLHSLRLSFVGSGGVVGPSEARQDVRLATGTRLVLPSLAAARGQGIDLSGRLEDARTAAVRGELVLVHIDSRNETTLVTSSEGGFSLHFTVPTDAPLGPHLVLARFNGTPDGSLGASSGSAILRVQATPKLTLAPPATLLRGDNPIDGRLVDEQGQGLAGALVTVAAGQAQASATTASDGSFRVTLPLGSAAPAGPTLLAAVAAADGDRGEGRATASVPLVVPAAFRVDVPAEAGRGATLAAQARLLDDVGQPLAGRVVSYRWLAQAGQATTDASGTVNLTLDVPGDAKVGATPLHLDAPADAGHAAAALDRDVTVKDGVRIVLEGIPAEATPGQALHVRVRVVDLLGAPVADAPVGVLLGSVGVAEVRQTNATGVASFDLSAPLAGPFQVTARFAGTPAFALQSLSSGPVIVKAAFPWTPVLLGAGLVVVAAAGVVGVIVVRKPLARLRSVEAILRETYRRIVAGDPWTAAVLLAYQTLSLQLSSRGFVEKPGETVRDFLGELVREADVPPDAAVALAHLFEQARYGPMRLDPDHAREARRVLREVLHAVRRTLHGRAADAEEAAE